MAGTLRRIEKGGVKVDERCLPMRCSFQERPREFRRRECTKPERAASRSMERAMAADPGADPAMGPIKRPRN